jgi:hypothetical protein
MSINMERVLHYEKVTAGERLARSLKRYHLEGR